MKLFVPSSYSFKWCGRSKRKLMMLSDDDDHSLENKLMEWRARRQMVFRTCMLDRRKKAIWQQID